MSAEQSRSPESVVREIRRKNRRKFTPSEKIGIVLEGLKGEESIAELWYQSPPNVAGGAGYQYLANTGLRLGWQVVAEEIVISPYGNG